MKIRKNNLLTLKKKRRNLRNNATPQELMIWAKIRNDQLGFRFRRQFSIGCYIVDFCCLTKKLIIEIDGFQHQDNEVYDKARTIYFRKYGFRVLRYWNNEINKDICFVVQNIKDALGDIM